MHCIRNDSALLLAAALAAPLAAGIASGAQADNHEQPTFVPVDMMTCSFKEDKDWDDLENLNKAFIKWVKQQEDSGYTYWIFTPRYHEGSDFDFAWLGGWADGNAMGAGWDAWVNSGGGNAGAAFAETVDCNASLAASLEVTRVQGAWPETGITWFARCELEDDATIFDALAAHKTAATEMNSMAPPSSSWLFLPLLGEGDPDFDYWHVQAWNSYASLGAGFEAYFNGGGWSTEAQIGLSEVEMCELPNLYDFRLMYDSASP
jgi:hypothetical protein